jgi:hypothetical protein
MKRAPKGTPTDLNVSALASVFAGANSEGEIVDRVHVTDAPHLGRCYRAGLVEHSRPGFVRLTEKGRTALALRLVVRFLYIVNR